jgi:transposase-like protein
MELGAYDPRFHDPLIAADYLVSIRWPNGKPVCPHCGEGERRHYPLKSQTRRLWKCAACRKQFSVTVGTIFESSHIGLHKWLYAFWLLCASKKGMSAHQLHRMLGVTYKTAWFMAHRIRMAMAEPPFQERLSGVVEADETYIGGKARNRHRRWKGVKKTGRGTEKTPVVALVERGGRVRSFRMANVTGDSIKGAIRGHVDPTATIMTDSFASYRGLHAEYAAHKTVDHWKEYVADGDVHTNTVENFFSIVKRGINGVYHHVSEAHLHRYLAEFDYRYNARDVDDHERTRKALGQVAGKRLRYSETRGGRP